MKVFYFIHITGTDTGISGIPRVVKNLGRELLLSEDIDLVPVCWSQGLRALVHAERKQLENVARHGGPKLEETSEARKPIAAEPGDWLLFAEAPHLHSYDREYPSVSISEPIGFARSCGLKVAAIFHDILPLLYDFGGPHSGVFADMTPGATGHSDGGEVQRLQFAVYAHSLALADIVFPVSRTTGDQLFEWLIRQGHRAELLPLMAPILLPEEVFGVERVIPHRRSGTGGAPVEFLAVGTVCAHKNQLGAMYAFHRLIQRRRELDLRLNIVGSIAAVSATAASLMAKRADGRIILHGHLPDEQLEALQNRARASVFVSLAEGYGLPVAESLWRGKPCLCSGEGSIA
jgi:Glycosyl transferases group 1